MRSLLLLCILFSIVSVSLKAQTPSSFSANYTQTVSFPHYYTLGDSSLNRKWFFTKYAGLSTGFTFFNGRNATILSAPAGLRLNHRINDNLYAFAGLSIAPIYINANQAFTNPGFSKNHLGSNFFNADNFGVYSRAEMGLMYINDEKTFSISGSIGIERNRYPFFPSNRGHQQPPPAYFRQ